MILPDGIPALYAQDGNGDARVVYARIHNHLNGWNWFVMERGTGADSDLCYGLVQGFENEEGYFSLEEMASVPGMILISWWTPVTIGEVKQKFRI